MLASNSNKRGHQIIETFAIFEANGHERRALLDRRGIEIREEMRNSYEKNKKLGTQIHENELSRLTFVLGIGNRGLEIVLERIFVLLNPLRGIVIDLARIMFNSKRNCRAQLI